MLWTCVVKGCEIKALIKIAFNALYRKNTLFAEIILIDNRDDTCEKERPTSTCPFTECSKDGSNASR